MISDDPLLKRSLANVQVVRDWKNNRMFSKKISRGRIDPAAAAMAFTNTTPPKKISETYKPKPHAVKTHNFAKFHRGGCTPNEEAKWLKKEAENGNLMRCESLKGIPESDRSNMVSFS